MGGLAAAIVIAILTLGGGSAPDAAEEVPVRLERISVGSGAEAATIVRPEGARGPAPGVIFFHGWGEFGRDDYRAWVEHLARAGNTVILPRYQLSSADPPEGVLDAGIAGVRAATEVAPLAEGQTVVAGHSAGAALAADYAAAAAEDNSLPRPGAIYAVFPGRAILGYPNGIPARDLSAIAPSTRIVAMAGSADKIVGEAPAMELIEATTQVPERLRSFVEVSESDVNGHYAPLRDDRSARKVFWQPLDALIAAVR